MPLSRIFALLLFICSTAFAQTTILSTVVGSVQDAQGGLVPAAAVALINADTGIIRKASTGANGEFVFTNLIAGRYHVEVTKTGFKRSVSGSSPLENGTTQRVNIVLEVGQVADSITVAGTSPLLQTDDASLGQVLENRTIRDIPIEGRNFLNYAVLAPMFNSGVGDDSRAAWGLASASVPGAKVLNLGGTEYGVGYYVDGVNSNDNWVQGPTQNVNIDAIQEVKAEVANYSAEYGRDPGQLNVTTKSGSNSLHGTGYLYRQNSGLNARDPYTIFEDPTRGRDPYHQNQYGFTVGGPVIIPKVFNGKNRAFFFSSFEQLRNRGGATVLGYVPTARERSGDFGEWLERFPGSARYVVYDPLSFDPATQTRTPFPNNRISIVDPRAAEFVSHFPTPNFVSPNEEDIRNWKGTTTNGLNNTNISARIDYLLTSKDNIYFKYTRDNGDRIVQGGMIPEVTLGNGPVHAVNVYAGHWTRTFSPTFTNEIVFGYMHGQNRSEDAGVINRLMGVPWYKNLLKNISIPGGGLSNFDKSQLQVQNDGLYAINFGDPFGSMNVGPGEYWYQVVPQIQVSDSLIKVLGRHTLKGGFNWFRRDERDNDIIRSVNFGGNYTGAGPQVTDGSGWNNLAEFMTGVVTSMTQRTNSVGGDNSLWFRMPEYSAYFNDTWQVGSKLTLNLGLRYELAPQAFSVNSYWGVLDTKYPGWRMDMPGTTPGTNARPFPADKNNVAPRIGFAYRPKDNWVIRGGYGIFYDTGRYKFLDQMFFNAPGYGGSQYSSADYAGINGKDPNEVFFTLDNSFPAALDVPKGDWPIPLGDKGGLLGPRMDTTTIDAQTPINPYYQRWSLDIQRQFGKDIVVTAGYTGSKGSGLVIADDLNLPPQGVYLNSEDFHQARPNSQNPAYVDRFGQALAIHHSGTNAYHSMTLKLQKRFSHGFTALTHLTWSKQTDEFFNTNGYTNISAIGGQWHREWSHGASDADHPLRFVTALTYEFPFAKNWNNLAGKLLGGWQINTVLVLEAGRPVTVLNGDSQSFDYMGDVPTRVCDGNLSRGDRSFYRYFDTSCFVNPLDANGDGIADHRGNSGRNVIRLPGINNWDSSLFKSIQVREGMRAEFRWETFNTFNHTQWSDVNTYNDMGTNPQSIFGRVIGGRPGRHQQWALKFIF